MPELPEVETVRNTLHRLVAGKTIGKVEISLPRIIRRPAEPESFARAVEGLTIWGVRRRGKFLIFDLGELQLLSHLRMEGRYGLFRREDEVEKHTHVRFLFTDGDELRYRDVRQFGTMDLYKTGEELLEGPLAKLGPEPLDDVFTVHAFRSLLAERRTKIKPLLLNQEFIAGLGNIYVDEVLHASGIHPKRTASSLSAADMNRLYKSIRDILSEAVRAGGSSVKSFVSGQGEAGTYQFLLKAYGRQGEPCTRCGGTIVRLVVAGRGTHVCLKCQPYREE